MRIDKSDSNPNTDGATPIDECQLLTVDEVASLLGVESRTVWRGLSKEEVPEPVRFRGNTRWIYRVIRDWIDSGCPAQNK